MSKERLEGIREDVGTNAKKEHEFITEILFEDALWLIEQSERVQELEEVLHDSYEEIRRGKNRKALEVIEDWGDSNE